MAKTKTYSLYLLKEHFKDIEDAFTESASEKIKSGYVFVADSETLGSAARIFIFDGRSSPAPWLSEVNGVFKDLPKVENKSSACVVVFKTAKRWFAVTFGHGWQYLDDSKVEADFGLRVAINTLGDDKLKKIERSHLGEALKGVSQSAFQRDLQAFGIEEALDLIRRVAGRAKDKEFAQNVSGATALKFTKEMEFSEIGDVAKDALLRHASTDYQATAFQIIDKVRPILDPVLLAKLNAEAVEAIKQDKDNFELSMPGWSDDDVVYYGMKGPGHRDRYPDLLMSKYREALGKKLKELTVETISSKHAVFAEFSGTRPRQSWSIKKALIGSIVLDGGLYAVSEGNWYRLDKQFKDDTDTAFKALVEEWKGKPEKIIKKISGDGKKTGLESELDYNMRCATRYGQICLDQKILTVPLIPHGKFEACDLLDIAGKRLIHVKKSSRQSSVLSHFFKQGSNSAKILKNYPKSRRVLGCGPNSIR